jgi:DNA/RNA-binding domain of Phe-tRNA-synthetase-like protein
MSHTIKISQEIFQNHPSFRRGVVIAKNICNVGESPELLHLLQQSIEKAAENPINLDTDLRIVLWNEAHRQFGSNPNKYLPSHRALLKRVQKVGTTIPFINRIVSIMNLNSITSKMPIGGDDLLQVDQGLELRYARGDEFFTPLGCLDEIENPEVGEIIYVSNNSKEVMCRRWNWRNGQKTAINNETQAIVMNIDGIGEEIEPTVLEVRDKVAEMLIEFCGADVTTAILTPTAPSLTFSL